MALPLVAKRRKKSSIVDKTRIPFAIKSLAPAFYRRKNEKWLVAFN